MKAYFQGQTPEDKNSGRWKEFEKSFREPKSPAEIKDFLKKVEIGDFFSEIKDAKMIGPQRLEQVVGIYEGTLVYDDPETEPLDVYIELDGEYRDNKIDGTYVVQLSRHGENTSNSKGSGTMEILKQVENADRSIFLELGGNMGYFQLYFINSNKALIGNFYSEKSMGNFEVKGRVSLTRK